MKLEIEETTGKLNDLFDSIEHIENNIITFELPKLNKLKVIKECSKCNREFNYSGGPGSIICRNCFKLLKCDYCKKYFIKTHSSKINSSTFCSRLCQNNEFNINRKYGVGALEKHRRGISKEELKIQCQHAQKLSSEKQWQNITQKERKEKLSKSILSKESVKKSQEAHLKNPELKAIMIQNLKGGIPKLKFCLKCNKEVMHNGNRCWKCEPWDFIFNRANFYNKKLEDIDFEFIDNNISLEEIDKYNGMSGIWAVYSENICLDVAQTKDIGNEIRLFLRTVSKGKENISISNEEIKLIHSQRSGRYIKYKEIASYEKLILKIVKTNIDSKDLRERIEVQYAHKNKAILWSRAPGQKLKPI